ncbi:MAG: flavin-containing monooxygenase [Gammaproteobacteria bacterium]
MTETFDAIVIGAGISGLYAVYRLRERGLSVRGFDAASGVGGTWYWNRYPGARFDSESYSYQYSFSKALFDEWQWSEAFAAQPEIERYLNFVADRFDLRREYEFDSRVEQLRYDEHDGCWELTIAGGRRARAQFVVAATGFLSAPQPPDYAGEGEFAGLTVHSARWPKEGVDVRGKRVGIIGSGPTAVQIIQTIAPDAGHLTVFQRTANWCTPLRNRRLTPDEQRELASKADEIVALCKRTFAGFIHDMDPHASTDEPSKEARFAKYQELYDRGGFALWFANYNDMFTNRAFAEEVSEFLAAKIRQRVKDPVVAEKLIPKNHPFGTKRPPGETNYYETFNRDNVELVDLRATPVTRITPRGVDTTAQAYDLDVLIYGTGFQSLTGALLRMDIRGEKGLTLREKWSDGPRTNMGVQIAGFPNFFVTSGPHHPAVFCNATRCAETAVEWIVDCIDHVRSGGHRSIQPTLDAEGAWTQFCYDSVKGLIIDDMRDSWFFGNNNPENKAEKRFLLWAGSVPSFHDTFAEVTASGYRGFEIR